MATDIRAQTANNWTALQFQFSHRHDCFDRRQQWMRPRIPCPPINKIENPPFHNRILIRKFGVFEFVQLSTSERKKSIQKWRGENDLKTKMNRSIHFYCRMWVEVKAADSCHRQIQCTASVQPHQARAGPTKKNLLRICMFAVREMCSELKSYSIDIVGRRSFVVTASLCNYTNCIRKPINT